MTLAILIIVIFLLLNAMGAASVAASRDVRLRAEITSLRRQLGGRN